MLTGKKLAVTWAEDFQHGDPLTEKIRTAISGAHWFILLLPDPSEDYDWCLFETGLFTGPGQIRPNRLHRVFCLHNQAIEPPEQIHHLLTIVARPGDHSEIEKFLRNICLDYDFFPGMGQLHLMSTDAISAAAKRINEAILPPAPQLNRRRFEALVRIHLKDPHAFKRKKDLSREEIQKLKKLRNARTLEAEDRVIINALTQENIKILNQAIFKPLAPFDRNGTNEKALTIFGKTEEPPNWGRLVSNVKTSRWAGELCFAIKDYVSNDTVTPIQATFTAANEAKSVIRPILYAADRIPDSGPIDAFLIIFVEDVSAPVISPNIKIPVAGYVQLASSIRLGYRFRWEVVEPFRSIREVSQIPELRDALHRVIKESLSRNALELDNLFKLFEKAEEARRVRELYLIFMTTVQNLETLLEDKNVEDIKKTLNKFASENQEYLKLATSLFANMNAELYHKERK